MFNRDSFPLLVGTAVFAFEGVGLQVTAHLSRRLQVADKQGHSHYSVDEGTKEVPWSTVRGHAGGCHPLRRSWCSRIHGLRIRYSNRRPRQPTPGRQVRTSRPIPLYVVLLTSSRACADLQTRLRSCFLSHYNSSQQSESWRMAYSSDQARTTSKSNGRKIYSELEQSFSVPSFPGPAQASWTSSSRSSEHSLGKLCDSHTVIYS
jgi:hypothetical protein